MSWASIFMALCLLMTYYYLIESIRNMQSDVNAMNGQVKEIYAFINK